MGRVEARAGRERANPEWREQRLVLTAAIGAAVGVLLQNSFNVEILGINVVLWAMAGAVSVVAVGAGVPVGLNPAAILRVERVEEAVPLEAPRRPHRRPARRGSIVVPLGIATVVVLALSWFASTWWRADRSYQLAVEGSNILAQPDVSSAEQTRALNSTLKAFRDAAKQNTIESRYPLTEATFQLGVLAAANTLNTENVQALDQTKGLLQNAIDRGPRDPVSLSSYGRLLARLRELSPASVDLEKEADLFTARGEGEPVQRRVREQRRHRVVAAGEPGKGPRGGGSRPGQVSNRPRPSHPGGGGREGPGRHRGR